MKRFGLIFLLFAVILSGFTGCGEVNQQKVVGGISVEKLGDLGGIKLPLSEKGTEINWIGVSSSSQTASQYIFDRLNEVTGLIVRPQIYPASSYVEKIKVLIASKNLPEIIGDGFSSIYEINDYGMQGAFSSPNDYLKELPNIKKLFFDNEETEWVSKSYAAADGKLYGLPAYDTSRAVNHGMLYRKDIFDKHGISMWNNPDEFYQTLKKLKDLYPDSTPFISKQQELLINSLSISWGLNGFAPYYDETNKVWKYSDTDPAMKELLDYLKKLYDEKLIDPEFFTLNQSGWTSKITQANKAFVTFDWIGRMDMFKAQTKDTVPEYDLRYGNPVGPKGTLVRLPKVLKMFSTVSKGKNEKVALKLMDFMYSPAGAQLMTMGIEGETYILDEKGMAKYLDFEEDKKVEITDLEAKYGMFIQGAYRRIDRRSCYFNFTQREQEAQDKGLKENRLEQEDPVLGFTKEEQETINEKKTTLNAAFKEFAMKYVLGSSTSWEQWLDEAKRLGVDELVSIYHNAQKRAEIKP